MKKRVLHTALQPAAENGLPGGDAVHACFTYTRYDAGRREQRCDSRHHLLLFLAGHGTIRCDAFPARTFCGGEMFLLPAGSRAELTISAGLRLLDTAFGTLSMGCGQLFPPEPGPLLTKGEYDFRSLDIRPPVAFFADTLRGYCRDGFRSSEQHELKWRELQLLMRWFYTDEELMGFFRPLLCRTPEPGPAGTQDEERREERRASAAPARAEPSADNTAD